MMTDTHSVIGVTEDVTGTEFLKTARGQVEDYGGEFRRGFVEDVVQIEAEGPIDTSETPAISKKLLATAIAHDGHASGPRTEATTALGDDDGTTADG